MFNPHAAAAKTKPFVLPKRPTPAQRFYSVFMYLHSHVQNVNSSKMFAGIMIITLNIASKFTTIKLSKTMEAYLKFSFSRDALIFAIAWVGSRDIYTAMLITVFFVISMDFLFNEESAYCIFPLDFKERHMSLAESGGATGDDVVTPDEIKRAKELLARAGRQTQMALDHAGSGAAGATQDSSGNIWSELKPLAEDKVRLPVQGLALAQYQNVYAYS